jgi:hypothetical protein
MIFYACVADEVIRCFPFTSTPDKGILTMVNNPRDSFVSDTSTTTYASTFSSLKASTLGLTDSPQLLTSGIDMSSTYHAPSPTANPAHPRNAPSPHRLGDQRQKSRMNLRHTNSTSSLDSTVEHVAEKSLPRPVQRTGHRAVTKKPSNLAQSVTAERARVSPQPLAARPASVPRPGRTEADTSAVPVPREPRPKSSNVVRKPVPREEPGRESPRQAMSRSMANSAEGGVRGSSPRREPAKSRPPPSPTRTADTMAEDWEAELARSARNMHISPQSGSTATQRKEQSMSDKEWEKSASWNDQRDASRDIEDRLRREASRAIGRLACLLG